jgi:hypothetical protein
MKYSELIVIVVPHESILPITPVNNKFLNYHKKLLLLIAASTALRLLFISATELSSDEVYYWTYALKLQWNYFDHPPMVAWLIRLVTLNLWLHSSFSVRLGAVFCCAVCTWLIFKIAALIGDARAGWFAALLYNACIYCSIIAGSFIMPDSPLMIFWLGGALMLVKISQLADKPVEANWRWCAFGLMAGLCIMCKLNGLFLWTGTLLYVLVQDRSWLKHRGIYLAALITLVLVSPIIIWNIQNNFISFKFHGDRINPVNAEINLLQFAKAVLQQITICNPVNFFLICSALVWLFKTKPAINKKATTILLFLALPMILLVMLISLFRETFPHWAGQAYSCLLIIPAIRLASTPKNVMHPVPVTLKWALAYMLFVALSQVVVINFYPGTVSQQPPDTKTGFGDQTLQQYGWRAAGEKFDSLYRNDVSRKTMRAGAPVIITNWDSGAAIEFYITAKTNQEVLGLGDIEDLHQYYWSNKFKKPLKQGDDAYFIIPSETFNYRTTGLVLRHFGAYETLPAIDQYRMGLPCRRFWVYRLRNYIGD